MDDANWQPMQGSIPAAGGGGDDPNAPAEGDWRAKIQPGGRSRVVSKILEYLNRDLPVSGPEGVSELQQIAVQFEEKIYTVATSQSDYLRKISRKMLSIEMQRRHDPGNVQVIPNQNNPSQAFAGSTDEIDHPGAGDSKRRYIKWRTELKVKHHILLKPHH